MKRVTFDLGLSTLRSEKEDYNPHACITRREPPYIDSNLRTQTINKFITNTERFGNFVTVKYA